MEVYLTADEGQYVWLKGKHPEETPETGTTQHRVIAPAPYVNLLQRSIQPQRWNKRWVQKYDDVMTWSDLPNYWVFLWGIHLLYYEY